MGPNEQNPHFVEFRQNVYLYVHAAVRQTGLASLDGKFECCDTKRRRAKLTQADYREQKAQQFW